MAMIKKSNAALFLVFNAFLWGSSYVWSKMLLGYIPRFSILFICSLGGLAATALVFFPNIKSIDLNTIKKSVIISFASIISNTFFILALQHTSSSNTAFIVQMSVVFTPLLSSFIDKKKPEGKIVLSAAISLSGLFFLTCDLNSLTFKAGDLLAVGNALFFSIFLTSQKYNSDKINSIHFTFVHHFTNAIAFFGAAYIFEIKTINFSNLYDPAFTILAGASIFITAATILIQSSAIRYVKPEKATLLYTFEPVAALVTAGIFIGERMDGMKAGVGCLLIIIAVIYSIYTPSSMRKISTNHIYSTTYND